MPLQAFISAYASKEAQTLCRDMAVADGNLSLDHITTTSSDAIRHIINYTHEESHISFTRWDDLARYLYDKIRECKKDQLQIKNVVTQIYMQVKTVAAYFHNLSHTDTNQEKINQYFNCIITTLKYAHHVLEALGYKHTEDFGVMNHKWNKPCFHAIAEIGLALERLGNIIQACLYKNGISTTIFDYQQMCDVVLVETITAESIAESMDWTTSLAQSYMNGADSKKIIAPLSTIPELVQAKKDLQIDDNGHLLVSNRAFVMYCYEHRFFLPLNKKDWKKIDGMLTSDQGKTLSAGDLAKVAQQLNKEFYFDKAIRYGK